MKLWFSQEPGLILLLYLSWKDYGRRRGIECPVDFPEGLLEPEPDCLPLIGTLQDFLNVVTEDGLCLGKRQWMVRSLPGSKKGRDWRCWGNLVWAPRSNDDRIHVFTFVVFWKFLCMWFILIHHKNSVPYVGHVFLPSPFSRKFFPWGRTQWSMDWKTCSNSYLYFSFPLPQFIFLFKCKWKKHGLVYSNILCYVASFKNIWGSIYIISGKALFYS